MLGDYPGAETNLRAAEATLAALPTPSWTSGGSESETTLGQVRGKLAAAVRQQGRLVEAEAIYRRAIDTAASESRPVPTTGRHGSSWEPSAPISPGCSISRSGTTRLRPSSAPRSTTWLRPRRSGRYEPRNILANCQNGYGLFLQKVGRVGEAEAQFRAAIATGSENVKAFPDEFDARSDLAITERN